MNGRGRTPGGSPVGINCPGGRNWGGGGIPGNIIGEFGDSTRNGEGTEFKLGKLGIPETPSTRFDDTRIYHGMSRLEKVTSQKKNLTIIH